MPGLTTHIRRRQRWLSHALSAVVLLSLAVPPATAQYAAAATTTPAPTPSAMAAASATPTNPTATQTAPASTTKFNASVAAPATVTATPTNLYRTTLLLPNQSGWATLSQMNVPILARTPNTAQVLVDGDQLSALILKRFEPHNTTELGMLVAAGTQDQPQAAAALQPLVQTAAQAEKAHQQQVASAADTITAHPQAQSVLAAVHAMNAQQLAAAAALSDVDSDGDGLTDTEESWWCTDPHNANSTGNGPNDGQKVQALLDWMANRRSGPPSWGPPFQGWPMVTGDPAYNPACIDRDQDSVPDAAEQYVLGLNPNRESTPRDKFDDGQKLFGITKAGWGSLPRPEDTGIIFAEMPSWVKAPGNHPLVAAYPVPDISVVPSSLQVQTVTTITTDHTIGSGTERSYSTADTHGTSDAVTNTVTWNSWQEVAVSQPQTQSAAAIGARPHAQDIAGFLGKLTGLSVSANGTMQTCAAASASLLASGAGCANINATINGDVNASLGTLNLGGVLNNLKVSVGNIVNLGSAFSNNHVCISLNCGTNTQVIVGQQYVTTQAPSTTEGSISHGGSGTLLTGDNSGNVSAQPYYQIQAPSPPIPTVTSTHGSSQGGSQATTHTTFDQQTVTSGNAYSNTESWANATAQDSAHTADFWFNYMVNNSGTEYAREISNLSFNIYLGGNPNPITTYAVAQDLSPSSNGEFVNIFPGDSHTYTSHHIPLSLDQLKTLDTGGALRIVVNDFSYGVDQVLYQDAVNSGVLVAIDDGDADNKVDTYLIPTWEHTVDANGNPVPDTMQDVLARYFPTQVDANNNIVAIATPEYVTSRPADCARPSGRTDHDDPNNPYDALTNPVWCNHALSTADWWNIYLNNLGDGTSSLAQTVANPGATAFFRFNKDSDLDGYSDRTEQAFGTDPNNPNSFPHPELSAGLTTLGSGGAGSSRTGILSLLNSGLSDAYGVQATMIAPDDSVSITKNTVGGAGRVNATKSVVVGSLITPQSPLPFVWSQPGHAAPATGGYYTGSQDLTYTFTVSCSTANGCDVGSGTWTLNWSDGAGNTGALNFASGYISPTPLPVAQGVQIALLTGHVLNGESFTVAATTPRDTFQYTVNRVPFTPPVVVVSYNDPQGNHRFALPPTGLATPTDSLLPFSGQMLPDPGLNIVTLGSFSTSSPNTTNVVVNNPTGATLLNAKVFLDFVDPSGTVAREVSVTPTTDPGQPNALLPGPTVVPVAWSTSDFSPAYSASQDYIVLAFLTDYQGNILATSGRPLSSFQADPKPTLADDDTSLTWNFGTAQQGTLFQHQFNLASVGFQGLLTYVGSAQGVTVTGPTTAAALTPGDAAPYTVTINTDNLPVGPYSATLPIRSSDPSAPTKSINITGTITAAPAPPTGGATIHPLDYTATIAGPHAQNDQVTITQNLNQPSPQTLQPIKVWNADYSTLLGVGQNATQFGTSAATQAIDFGTGQNGSKTFSASEDPNPIRATASGAQGSTTLSITVATASGFTDPRIGTAGLVLIHQTRGANAGQWETNQIVSASGSQLTLAKPLAHAYTTDTGANRAQVLWVPQYTDVTVSSGVTLSPHAWDGSTGGIIAWLASGTLAVSGTIQANGQPGVRGCGNQNNCNVPGGGGAGFSGGSGQTYSNQNTELAWAAEGSAGPSVQQQAANGSGGGGGYNPGNPGGSPGGSGSDATAGSNGTGGNNGSNGVGASAITGSPDLTSMTFGGGGGGAARESANSVASGGAGGGIIVLIAGSLQVGNSGMISANGGNGGPDQAASGRNYGGAGAGGSVLLRSRTATIPAGIIAASGGSVDTSQGGSGHGGDGRVRIEYCNSGPQSAVSVPAASVQQLSCYIVSQVPNTPYTSATFTLPEVIANGTSKSYEVQYGQLLTFAGAGSQQTSISLPKQVYTAGSLDALISNTGTASGQLSLSLDVGNDGTPDYSYSASTTFPATLTANSFVQALDAYLTNHSEIAWGDMATVPIDVTTSGQATVILTNLALGIQSVQPSARISAQDVNTGADRPLDWTLLVPGDHNQGDVFTFTPAVGSDSTTLEPCAIYDQNGHTPEGVGSACVPAAGLANPLVGVGDGGEGALTVSGTVDLNPIRASANGTSGSSTLSIGNVSGAGFAALRANALVMIHQTLGGNAGTWELNNILSATGSQVILARPLRNSYVTDSSGSAAQVIWIPQYTTLTIPQGSVVAPSPWNGQTGGITAIASNTRLSVAGTIDASSTGFNYTPWAPDGEESGLSGVGTNGASGGSGAGDYDGRSGGGGGGGGNAAVGASGTSGQGPNSGNGLGGDGGGAGGNAVLTNMILGGGGGSGGHAFTQCGTNVWWDPPVGGQGGGIVLLLATALDASTGQVRSNGSAGNSAQSGNSSGGGGGGAGGSILIQGEDVNLGSSEVATSGGSGGNGNTSCGSYGGTTGQTMTGGNGGAGSNGRISVNYCDNSSGSTSPAATTQQIGCYIADQHLGDPTQTDLTLPETFTGGKTYIVQFGRRYSLAAAGSQSSTLRMDRQVYGGVSLDALVSNTTAASGTMNLCLMVGSDTSCDYTSPSGTQSFPATFTANGQTFLNAINTYLEGRTDVAWGTPVDVPVTVQVDQQADVMLTNLALTPAGAVTKYLRLPARQYSNVSLGLQFGGPSAQSSGLSFTADVGADGQVEWSSTSATFPTGVVTSPGSGATASAITSAVNAYLNGKSGDVDVPIRIIPSGASAVSLVSFSATPAALPDLRVGNGDINFGAQSPTEGDVVPVTATVHNPGGADSGGFTASFFGNDPGLGNLYLGSAYVPNVPAGGSAQASIQWNTLGYEGPIPVQVVLDPFNHVAEAGESNNVASASLTVLTRPDLSVTNASASPNLVAPIRLNDPQPVAGESLTVSVDVTNAGQTTAQNVAVQLWDGQPNAAGASSIGMATIPSIGAQQTQTASIPWTASAAGAHTLVAVVDPAGAIAESDRTNNTASLPTFVGFAGPILIDSGAAAEQPYSPQTGYGYLVDSTSQTMTCGPQAYQTLRLGTSGQVTYQFDNLQPGHFYHVDLTLYECDGAQRQETVSVNGVQQLAYYANGALSPSSGPVNLADGLQHKLSFRLDPSTYANHTVRVSVQSPGTDGAVVSQINLSDVDYRAADAGAGSATDPPYPTLLNGRAYGWLNGVAQTGWGTLPSQSVRINQTGNTVQYRFDNLSPSKSYVTHLTFWQPSGPGRSEKVQIDGVDSGATVTTGDYQIHTLAIQVPPSAYADGSITVSVVRTDSNFGAIVNQIDLEEATTSLGTATLSLNPGAATVNLGGTVNVDVVVNASGFQVDGAEVHLDFNPSLVHVVTSNGAADATSVTAGASLPNVVQNTVDNTAGHIDFSAGLLSGTPPGGVFTLATITFKALAVTPSGGMPLVWASGPGRSSNIASGGGSIFGGAANGLITVSNAMLFNGKVAYQGRGAAPSALWQLPLQVQFIPSGQSTIAYATTVTTDASGGFSLPLSLAPGTYDVLVKNNQMLGVRLAAAQVAAGTNPVLDFGTLLTGDVDNDNVIDVLDFSALRVSFGKPSTDPAYNPAADLNGDGTVDLLDFSLLRANFNQAGPPIATLTPTPSASPSPTDTATPSASPSPTDTPTPGATPTDTPVPATPTPTAIATVTATPSPTTTATPTATLSPSPTPTLSPTATYTPTLTPTPAGATATPTSATPTSPPAMTQVLFSDGFESGAPTGWNKPITTGTNSSVTVTASAAAAGSYGLDTAKLGASDNGQAQLTASISTPSSKVVSLRTRLRVVSRSGSGGLYLQQLYRASPLYQPLVVLHAIGASYNLQLRNKDGSFQRTPLTTQLAIGTWYDVELVYDWSGASPVASVYINGSLDSRLVDTTTGTVYAPDQAHVGLWEDAWSQQAEADWDTVSVADGLQSGH